MNAISQYLIDNVDKTHIFLTLMRDSVFTAQNAAFSVISEYLPFASQRFTSAM